MKKSCFCLLAFVFLLTALALPAFANTNTETVYGLPGEQEKVMQLFENGPDYDYFAKKKYSLQKSSIMPFYYGDLYDYARDGVFRIRRKENRYVADFFLEDGQFGGIVYLETNQEYARWYLIEESRLLKEKLGRELIGNSPLPCSYAYHRDFIRSYLGEDVTEEDVRYVSTLKGCGFYINGKNERPEALVSVGHDTRKDDESRIVWIDEKLKSKAEIFLQEHEKDLAKIEAWKKEHPGEEYPYVGGTFLGSVTEKQEKRSNLFPIIGASVLAGAGILAVILLAAKKRKRAS